MPRLEVHAMQSFPPTSADSYKVLARSWAATVTVVTARRADEHLTEGAVKLDGFTATAFLTVSITPPIILVSVTAAASALALLRESAGFAVNLLNPDQADLAGAFAKPQAERVALWTSTSWSPDADGVPLLAGTTGAFSAKVRQIIDAGDHALVLGDVTAIHLGEGSDTLVYHNRAYGRVARAPGAG
jgi:flavin reductase (DIM6/NTAB) family NADH-FMN oxidoreductase RutF